MNTGRWVYERIRAKVIQTRDHMDTIAGLFSAMHIIPISPQGEGHTDYQPEVRQTHELNSYQHGSRMADEADAKLKSAKDVEIGL